MTTNSNAGSSPVDRKVGHPWLTECQNKMHIFELGRWLFAAQVARDFWANEEKGRFRCKATAATRHREA